MGRSRERRNADAPTHRDELVKAVVGAHAPPRLDLSRMQARAARTEDVRPIRANARELQIAFGNAPELGRLIWRAKYFGDTSPAVMIEGGRKLLEELEGRGARKKRRARSSGTMYLLALTAFAEWAETRCLSCKGSGMRGDGKNERWVWSDCGRCHGTGRLPRYGMLFEQATLNPRMWRDLSRPCATELVAERVVEGCGGVGRVRDLDRHVQQRLLCRECHGSGRIALGEFQRASNLGMDVEGFRKNWGVRYELALTVLQNFEERTAIAIDLAIGKPQYRVSEESVRDCLTGFPPDEPDQEDSALGPSAVAHGEGAATKSTTPAT